MLTNIQVFRALSGDCVGALLPPGAAGEIRHPLSVLANREGVARWQAVREHFERELNWPVVGARAAVAYRVAPEARRAEVRA